MAVNVPWQSLASWDSASTGSKSSPDVLQDPLSTRDVSAAPFVVSPSLNAKISLWRGPLHCLRVDGVVHSTCESMRESDGEFARLLKAAGPEIAVECDAAGACRTGDAVLTRGCQLPAQFILHTVGPRYLPKYHNAAEHALHSSYRSVLTVARENGLLSVALGCIYTQRKGYPREEAAHIAARTVRRYLEHYADSFGRIIFCVEALPDMIVYERVLPLYFPRSVDEQRKAEEELATRDLGDSFGEPIIAERKIRIGDLSGASFVGIEHCNQNGGIKEEQPEETCEPVYDVVTHADNQEAESDIQAFRAMLADPDAERLHRLKQMQEERQRRTAAAAVEEQKRLEKATANTAEWDYVATLQRAKRQDFSDLRALEFCYSGVSDLAGLPVVVYLAGKLLVEDVDLERVLLFVLLTLDSQRAALTPSSPQFSVLYVHSDVTSDNQPPTSWIKRLFRVFAAVATHRPPSERPLHNEGKGSVLRFFYVLEPSIGLKFQILLSKGYCDGGGFYNQVVYLQRADMLDAIAPKLRLPSHIYTPKLGADIPTSIPASSSTSPESALP